jgi:hypothetical protein
MSARRTFSKEGCHAPIENRRRPPPRRISGSSKTSRQANLQRLWATFPVEERERILNTLIGVVAQQLAKPPDFKEATHEHL